MTLQQLLDNVTDLARQISAASTALAAAATNPNTPMDEVLRQQTALLDLQTRHTAAQMAYDSQYNAEAAALPTVTDNVAPGDNLRAMLKSNEYARAFAHAIRMGAKPSRGLVDQQHKVLFDALTIAGGSPEGSDGGFLVPEDIDHTVRERRRELSPLADLFTVENTSTDKGWRVMDTAPTKGMTALTSEIPAAGIPMDDQPEFAKVPFALTSYGLILPVSNELAADEVANLFNYLSKWLAKKHVITENLLLKAQLEKLVSVNIATTDDAVGKIKSVLNKELDPAISLTASLLTNQDGFDYLDQLKDETGRPMLQPDPTDATLMRFKGRSVKMMANSLLKTRTVTTAGASKGEYYPIYVGDFSQYATLFMRQNLEIASTDVGGNAFRTNSIEVRGISRMGVSSFDTEAAVRREIFIPAT